MQGTEIKYIHTFRAIRSLVPMLRNFNSRSDPLWKIFHIAKRRRSKAFIWPLVWFHRSLLTIFFIILTILCQNPTFLNGQLCWARPRELIQLLTSLRKKSSQQSSTPSIDSKLYQMMRLTNEYPYKKIKFVSLV